MSDPPPMNGATNQSARIPVAQLTPFARQALDWRQMLILHAFAADGEVEVNCLTAPVIARIHPDHPLLRPFATAGRPQTSARRP